MISPETAMGLDCPFVGYKCVADKCMAWRWDIKENWDKPFTTEAQVRFEKTGKGYCKLIDQNKLNSYTPVRK